MRRLTLAALIIVISAALVRTHAQSEQDTRITLTSNARDRAYRIFIPDAFGKNGPGPAVVLFNGSGSPVDGLIDPWKEIARKEGVALIGPEAFKPGAWRIPEDSPDFTQAVVVSALSKFPIDPRRIYLFGHSGGAGHVILLGLLESESFAAVGAHASALRAQDRRLLEVPKRKIPIAIWSGTEDALVPIKAVRETLAVLTAKGFPAQVSELRGHTHSYGERAAATTAEAWEFLKRHALSADPVFYKYAFK